MSGGWQKQQNINYGLEQMAVDILDTFWTDPKNLLLILNIKDTIYSSI